MLWVTFVTAICIAAIALAIAHAAGLRRMAAIAPIMFVAVALVIYGVLVWLVRPEVDVSPLVISLAIAATVTFAFAILKWLFGAMDDPRDEGVLDDHEGSPVPRLKRDENDQHQAS